MAAQSGVWFFDERPIDEECRRLEQGLRPMAPDGVSTFAGAGIAMAFGANHVWTGEESARQPRRSSAGLIMTWDGRLDNRDDLVLRLDGRLPRDMSDADIALAAFERWGIDGLRSLIGDWSLAIWDEQKRELHLARDYMGVRPLYYCLIDRGVMWSTSLGELATRTGRVDDLDEAFVARFMALQFSTDVTPYKGIRGVPTAHCVSISADGLERRRRFWQLEPGSIRYRDGRQYEEQLRALWAEAVGCRLRTTGTAWAELSGGLDSSSVVCMADALIKAGRVQAHALRTVSHVTLESPEGDERRFIAEVEQQTAGRSDVLGVEMHAAETDEELSWISPLAPGGVRIASARHIRDRGGRAVLTGRVGDVTMGCTPDNSVAVFEDLSAFRLGRAFANLQCWARACRVPFIEVVGGLARQAARIERAETGAGTAGPETGVDLLVSRLRGAARVTRSVSDEVEHVPLAKRDRLRLLMAFSSEARLETWPEALLPVTAHPFTHRPLVDYMMAIPAEQLSAPGDMRSLMRRAFAGIMPSRVLGRTSKGYYPPAASRLARLQVQALPQIEQIESVTRGWIDAERLRAALQVAHRAHANSDVQLLLKLEQWLTSRHRRGPAAMPQRKEVRTNEVRIA